MIPKDPVMLLSYVNTQLRDNFGSLKEMCKAFNVEENYIKKQLEMIDYRYCEEKNKFL